MPQLIEETERDLFEAIAADKIRRAEERRKLTASLGKIGSEVTIALGDAGLAIPVYLTVPTSGDALVTFCTPLDPDEQEWDRVCEIIVEIVKRHAAGENLQARKVACIASGISIGAADITAAGGGGSANPNS